MSREIGHGSFQRRVAIMVGAGYVPGINAVILGAALAAGKLGWEMVGIRDGFDGLLHPERYPEGGLLTLEPRAGREPGPNRRRSPRPGAPGRPVPRPPGQRRRHGRGSRHVRRAAAEAEGGGHRRPDLRRRRPRADHPLQAAPQGAQRGVRAALDRERHRRHHGVLRLQQRPQLHHRDARPGSSGGPVRPQDRRGRGPRRAGRMAGPAGRHRRVRRRGADPGDPLRPAGGGVEVAGQGDTAGGRTAWWWWPKGRSSSPPTASPRRRPSHPQGVAVAAGDG